MTRLSVERRAPGAADLVLADPQRWLPEPGRPAGPDRWQVTMHAGLLRRTALIELGPVWEDGTRAGRPIRWWTDPEPGDILPLELLLPAFDGEIVGTDDVLRIHGSYEPPGGVVGRAVDIPLSRLARLTVRRFVADLARQAPQMNTRG